MSIALRNALFCFLSLIVSTTQAALVTQWTFNGGVTTPSTGAGTATLVSGTTATFATGSPGDTGTGNMGWNLAGFPAQGTKSGMAGSQFAVSTAGYSNIVLSFDLRQSGTASRYFQLLVSSDGTNFSAPSGVGTIVGPNGSGNTATSFSNTGLYANTTGSSSQNFVQGLTFSFAPGSSFENDPNFKFKLVAIFDPANNTSYTGSNGTYGTAGTLREDLVTVSGTVMSVPEAPALLFGSLICGVIGLGIGARKLKG